MLTYDETGLRAFAATHFEALGLDRGWANLVADTLLMAERWGHPSHGVMRLGWYGARLRSGAANARIHSYSTSISGYTERMSPLSCTGSGSILWVLDGPW